jgi:hypothetical protein
MGEHQSVGERQNHQSGNAASRQESDLKDRISGERKVT